MVATISCTCGFRTQRAVDNSTTAQVLADTHEAQFPKRAYRHRADYTLQRGTTIETPRETIARTRKGINRILGRF